MQKSYFNVVQNFILPVCSTQSINAVRLSNGVFSRNVTVVMWVSRNIIRELNSIFVQKSFS